MAETTKRQTTGAGEEMMDGDLRKKLDASQRLTCNEVGKMCGKSRQWAHEQHAKKNVGFTYPPGSKTLYWYKAWLYANAKKI